MTWRHHRPSPIALHAEEAQLADIHPREDGNVRTRQGQIWMLTMYGKSDKPNIPAHTLRQIKDEIDD